MKRTITLMAVMMILATSALAVAPEIKAVAAAATSKVAAAPTELSLDRKYDAYFQLNEFLTSQQQKSQARIDQVMAYLKSINKLEAYENSDKPEPSKTSWSFEKVLATAEKYEKDHPDQVAPLGEGEGQDILAKKVAFLKKECHKEYNQLLPLKKTEAALGAYLKSIGKLNDYKSWAGVEKEKKAQAAKAAHEKWLAEQKKKLAAEEAEKKAKSAQEAAYHRNIRMMKMQMQYQYDMLRQKDNTLKYEAYHGGFAGNRYWSDNYDDVYGSHSDNYYPQNVYTHQVPMPNMAPVTR